MNVPPYASTESPAESTPGRARRRREYKHPCPHCPRYFTCKHNVSQHINERHRTERDHKCTECRAEFARPWGLSRHLLDVHGIDIRPGRGKASKKPKAKETSSLSGARDSVIGVENFEPNFDTYNIDNPLHSSTKADTTLSIPMPADTGAFLAPIDQRPFVSPQYHQNFQLDGNGEVVHYAPASNQGLDPFSHHHGNSFGAFQTFEIYENTTQTQEGGFQQFISTFDPDEVHTKPSDFLSTEQGSGFDDVLSAESSNHTGFRLQRMATVAPNEDQDIGLPMRAGDYMSIDADAGGQPGEDDNAFVDYLRAQIAEADEILSRI